MNGLTHIELSNENLTVSFLFEKWKIAQIPISSINRVSISKVFLTFNVCVFHEDSHQIFRNYTFHTLQHNEWLSAFKKLGIQVSTDGSDL
jgi:hypothetical protein